MNQPTAAPTRKLVSGTVAGLVVSIVEIVLRHLFHMTIDPDLDTLITDVTQLLPIIVASIIAYMTPASHKDVPVPIPPPKV
jgi:hypothetical protein